MSTDLIELATQIREEFSKLHVLMEQVLARAEQQGNVELQLDSCRRIMQSLGHQSDE